MKYAAIAALAFILSAAARETERSGEARASEARLSERRSEAAAERRPRAPSEDWSRFRGPNGTGIANVTGLPAEFGPAKNVVWKAATPAGHSSPVLTDRQIFMTGIDGEKLV